MDSPMQCAFVTATLIASATGVSLRGSRHATWPPANQIYSNPNSPPEWMRPSTVDPTLPFTAPPPVPMSIAPLPSTLSYLPLYYYSPAASVAAEGGGSASAWPPTPPAGPPAIRPGYVAMRPLSLLDAHGAEYMKDAKKLERRGGSAAAPSAGTRKRPGRGSS